MDHLRKVKMFIFMNKKSQLLFLEAVFYLGIARILKSVPFHKIVHLLGEENKETTYITPSILDKKTLVQISQAINTMSRYTLWESMCLVKAIACMKMLERRHIGSTLYLGIAKDQTGSMIAHAWLRSGPYYLTGYEEKEKFTVVSQFAKNLRGTDGEKE
ncbi:lasso peptide biosynthesis B2 protein [Metabacillus litoralis]|uniref:Lasso peptide biosynthesis B2 protein n=1 Tax=Metabacillus litoralis TaxID=152268 RepID=A0A5C6W981_9BACI|nr:lasso peptide biosynthesis B2 protein [Metabacillus litoralis]TXC92351.1 lasso peptide biosynthesis B2 protein [Metabacillus litoralis]